MIGMVEPLEFSDISYVPQAEDKDGLAVHIVADGHGGFEQMMIAVGHRLEIEMRPVEVGALAEDPR